MHDLSELYQEVILDHNKRPRNFKVLEDANRTAEGYNPLCGDQLTVYLLLEGDIVKNIAFQGSGCAISKASASIMTSTIKGKSLKDAEELFNKMHRIFTGEESADYDNLGKLAALAGVSQFPTRIKCATLPWHTFRAALESKQEEITTE